MSTPTETARLMLATLHGIRDMGGGQHIAARFSDDVRAVLVRLAAEIPDLIRVWKTSVEPGTCNGISITAPCGACLSFQRVAPACYEAPTAGRYDAEFDAYRALVRLADLGTAVDDEPTEAEIERHNQAFVERMEGG